MTTGNWGLKAIKAPEAWNYISRQYADPEDIQIGIMEVGPLDTAHEDLKGNLYHVHQELEKKKAEETAHGTYVAGIIGAEYNNNCGITGVMMDNVKLNYYSYNMAKDSGMQSAMCYIASLDALIKAAGTEQTAIINVSMGIQDYQVCATLKNKTAKDELKYLNQAIESQLHMLLNKGYDFLIVKAAGNCSYQR